jgi:deoxyribodipyrimidine photo-lyase
MPTPPTQRPILVWFRRNLRLADNAPLYHAIATGQPIIPIFLWTPEADAPWQPGAASRWWLHHALQSLQENLKSQLGLDLVLQTGNHPAELLAELAKTTQATAVYTDERWEPFAIAQAEATASVLSQQTVDFQQFNTSLLNHPTALKNKQGLPFKVFTPFWKTAVPLIEQSLEKCLPIPPKPENQHGVTLPSSVSLESLQLLPTIAWDAGFYADWTPTLEGAKAAVSAFLKNRVEAYFEDRNRPDLVGTSKLSPYLHFGQIGARQVWWATQVAANAKGKGGTHFLSELGWREFAHHLLVHFPTTPTHPLRADFEAFPWANNATHLQAWQQGETGYPIVDAGMKELWHTGWMHNRSRMIVGSFLVKHLLLPWQAGARWFWETLVDADLAQNTMGWQWIGGCGADAAPYFRIFNPVLQGLKFDTQGDYVKKWNPALINVPADKIHSPWEQKPALLRMDGVTLGENYPTPIVDHNQARTNALAAFATIKKTSEEVTDRTE